VSPGRSLRHQMAEAAADRRMVAAVHLATWRKVEARTKSLQELRHADQLRQRAAEIRQHTLDNLPGHLEQFVQRITANGASVHFAPTAAAARQIICDLAARRRLKLAVKSKSMTTEEVGLNAALAAVGVRVVETDLGEFMVQIDRDRPSHIITPIIHKDRRQVGRALARELGCQYTEDPAQITRIVRGYLRDIFRHCDLGISGANFGIAQTGTICLITNEGNGRMTVTRPRVHVALLGIEKIIPRLSDLPVFLKLLARSSTGQPMGAYTTLVSGPKRPTDCDGPEELHVVLLDNGRSRILRGPLAEVLRCVRCGACLNACPVYRNVGGHAYNSVYPGPIGSLLTPLLYGPEHHELPRASSLCGACRVACLVQIDIPELLVRLRAAARGRQPLTKRLLMQAWSWAMCWPWLYRRGQKLLRRLLPDDGQGWGRSGIGPLKSWTRERDLRRPPALSFRDLWPDEPESRDRSGPRVGLRPDAGFRPARTGEFGPEGEGRIGSVGLRSPVADASRRWRSQSQPNDLPTLIADLRSRLARIARPTPLPEPPGPELREVGSHEDLSARFVKAAEAAGCRVHFASQESWLARIGEVLRADNVARVIVQPESDTALTEDRASELIKTLTTGGIRATASVDDSELFAAAACVTGVQLAVAETGTLVCVSSETSARGATLIPPIHVALVSPAQLVADLFDAFERLAQLGPLPAQVSLITGPSKTADIEGVLVTGVHGPGVVHIVLISQQ